MANRIATDTFETLGQTVKQVAGQVVQEPGKVVETATTQMEQGVMPAIQKPKDPVQEALNKEAAKKQTKRRLTVLEDELALLRQRRVQEIKQAEVQEKVQEKQIKQLEVEEKKKEVSPVAVAKQKGGTGERKKMGGGV
ncbi:MAG: hypothetical protein Q7S03_03710 [bacterium]|nr:hypothetical protein [bacterium]